MATIVHRVVVDCPPAAVWDAVRDIGALHSRLVPGFVTATSIVAEAPLTRLVEFANGVQLRERIVACDDAARRLVWSIEGDGVDHHNGAIEVADSLAGGSAVSWRADVLPDALAVPFGGFMEQGLAVMKRHLEASQSAPDGEASITHS